MEPAGSPSGLGKWDGARSQKPGQEGSAEALVSIERPQERSLRMSVGLVTTSGQVLSLGFRADSPGEL